MHNRNSMLGRFTKRFMKDIFCKVKLLRQLIWRPLVCGVHTRTNFVSWQYIFMIGHNVSLDRSASHCKKHCL